MCRHLAHEIFVIARGLPVTHPLAFSRKHGVNMQKLFVSDISVISPNYSTKDGVVPLPLADCPKPPAAFLSFSATELRQVTGDLWLLEVRDLNLK